MFFVLFIFLALGAAIYFVHMKPKLFGAIDEKSLNFGISSIKSCIKIISDLSNQISKIDLVSEDNTPIYAQRGMKPRLFDTLLRESLNFGISKPKSFVKIIPDSSNQILNQNLVRADNTPVYVQRGWRRAQNRYSGYYRTLYGAWAGAIERRGDKFNVFIIDPPIEKLRHHSRWPCFHEEGGGKWRINLAVNPVDQDVNSIILYVESVINTSFKSL